LFFGAMPLGMLGYKIMIAKPSLLSKR